MSSFIAKSSDKVWETFQRLIGGESELRGLRASVTSLLQVQATESATPKELAELISSDPLLAARVLRLVNSPAFGLRHSVNQLDQAITLLGRNQIRDVVLSIRIAEKGSKKQESRLMRLWKHSMYCAKVGEVIAKTIGKYAGEAFTLGLLHDIGKIVLCHRNEPAFSATVADYTFNKGKTPPWYSETKVLKINHAEIGGMAAMAWKLPEFISQVIWRHHAPINGMLGSTEDFLVQMINMADLLCWKAGYPSIDGPNPYKEKEIILCVPETLYKPLGLTAKQCEDIYWRADTVLKSSKNMFDWIENKKTA